MKPRNALRYSYWSKVSRSATHSAREREAYCGKEDENRDCLLGACHIGQRFVCLIYSVADSQDVFNESGELFDLLSIMVEGSSQMASFGKTRRSALCWLHFRCVLCDFTSHLLQITLLDFTLYSVVKSQRHNSRSKRF
jgi:hypothetical protein